jgi:tRNA pseudouridine38-40 synthase
VRDLALVDDVAIRDATHAAGMYEYRILNAPAPSPFWRLWAWHVARPLDVAAMDAATRLLVGEHDFAAFRAADARDAAHDRASRAREPHRAGGPLLLYRVEATAFLKHMVRNVVGRSSRSGSGSGRPGAIADLDREPRSHPVPARPRRRTG